MKNCITATLLSLFVLFFLGCGGDTDQQVSTDADTTDTTEIMMPDMEMDGDSLNASLTGGADGDPDGSGTASVVLNSSDNEVCFEIEVENIEEPTAAHIHRGAAGTSGPPVVDFNIGTEGLSACVTGDAAIIADIQAMPSNFYVNVHNEEYGGGAVRGQLGSGGM